jgi:hypothetical protein
MTQRSYINAFQVPDGHILQRHPPTWAMGVVISQLMSELYDLLKEVYFRDCELDPIDMYVAFYCLFIVTFLLTMSTAASSVFHWPLGTRSLGHSSVLLK